MRSFTLRGQLADIQKEEIYPAEIRIEDGKITSIEKTEAGGDVAGYIIPGFIDSHVHIESSLLVPSEFARLAVVHGTVATVSDPHEIANVCGMEGVEFMIRNGKEQPFHFFFGAPSCVPATSFETAGATLDVKDVTSLLEREEIKYLSEMMNFPGVLNNDPEVMQKIQAAHRLLKPVDGHAPGLRGEQARDYIAAGISTDHECFTKEEALDKLAYGMKILIREGSAAKNFEALVSLLQDYPNQVMFCSDDKHPDSLAEGHINKLCARAVGRGINVFSVLKAACVNPNLHYNLGLGQLKPGDPADMVVVKDLVQFEVLSTFVRGQLVAENGRSLLESRQVNPINNFHSREINPEELRVPVKGGHVMYTVTAIEALDGQLITNKHIAALPVKEGFAESNTEADVVKIAVVNRYEEKKPAVAFIRNTGMKKGAIASSVAHDSHNIVVAGVDDESMCRAVNLIMKEQGGLSCVVPKGDNISEELVLPLPVAGLMSSADGYRVAEDYIRIDAMAKSAGSTLSSPFMTLSFMALLVIPHLKLSDQGLFDGDVFELVSS